MRRYLTRGHSIGTSVITRVNTIAKAHLFVAVFSQLSILLIAYGGYSNYHGSCTLLLQINSFAPENSICVVPVTVHRLCQVQWLNVPRAKIPCGKHPNVWNLIIRFIVVGMPWGVASCVSSLHGRMNSQFLICMQKLPTVAE